MDRITLGKLDYLEKIKLYSLEIFNSKKEKSTIFCEYERIFGHLNEYKINYLVVDSTGFNKIYANNIKAKIKELKFKTKVIECNFSGWGNWI